MYEPGARHTFSEAVGKNVANPTAILLCAAKMLKHINLQNYSNRIIKAVEKVLKSGKVRKVVYRLLLIDMGLHLFTSSFHFVLQTTTKDIGGQASTMEFTNAVIHALV